MTIAIVCLIIAVVAACIFLQTKINQLLALNSANLCKPEREELPPGWALLELGDEFLAGCAVHQVIAIHDDGRIETRVVG